MLDGALRLREAALHVLVEDDDAIVRALDVFKQELTTMRFSAASTDKMSNNAGFKSSDDSLVVAALMDELVELFGKSWHLEQNKQQELTLRFKADVPLLSLTPRSWKSALNSLQPVLVITAIASAAFMSLLLILAIAMGALGVEYEWGAVGVCLFCVLGVDCAASAVYFVNSNALDLRMPKLQLALKYFVPGRKHPILFPGPPQTVRPK